MIRTEERNELENEALLDSILEVTTGKEEEKADVQDVPVEDKMEDLTLAEDENIPEEETDSSEEGLSEEEEEEETIEEKSPKQKKEEEKSFRMKRLLRKALREDDGEGGNLKDMFNDMQISGEWLKRHWTFLLLVFVCMLVFVTNRYQAQQEIIEEARLKQELNDWRFIWLTQFSELTRSSRQSFIEESLKQRGDSTLKPSKVAPFILKVEGKKENGKYKQDKQ